MEEEIRTLIEDYQSNLRKLKRLQAKLLVLLQYNTKITASYGHNNISSKGSISSKVERHVTKIFDTEQKIIEVANDLWTVDIAQKVLNNKENEVIELIKEGYNNKLTKIAKVLDKDKKYVFDTRKRAIRKMAAYINQKVT